MGDGSGGGDERAQLQVYVKICGGGYMEKEVLS